MTKQSKTIYEVCLKNGAVIEVEEGNRIMALKKAVREMGVDESNIKQVRLQGGKRTYRFPLAREVDLHSARPVKTKHCVPRSKAMAEPPTPVPVPSMTCNSTGDQISTNGDAMNFITGGDQWTESKKVAEEKDNQLQAKDKELEALREAFTKNDTDSLMKALEYIQGIFTEDMQAIAKSNEYLREENNRLRDKMKEGVNLTLLPGGHVILVYGGRVLELSDLPVPGA